MEIYIMFKFIKDKVDEISRLKQENRDLQNKYELQKQAYDVLLAQREHISASEAVIDFKNLRVFSVERYQKDGDPCTLLGYFLTEPVIANDGSVVANKDVVHQWYLYCSVERHEEIVRQYKESLK
jgi:hypothetical protein